MNRLRNNLGARRAVCAGCALILALPTLARDRLCFEAEQAHDIEPPMRIVRLSDPPEDAKPVPGASGDAYIEIPAGSGNPPEVNAGKAVFEIDIPAAGAYTLWARVYWDDECSNSLSVQIDDGPKFLFGQTATYKTWHWVRSPPRLAVMNLEPGLRRITFHNREDGVRIDQILLTRNRRLIPVNIEPITLELAPRE